NIFTSFLKSYQDASKGCVIDTYIKILTSENYKILFQILPGCHLLYLLKKIMGNTSEIIKEVRYLQLVICVFESCRFQHFKNKNIGATNLQNLYLDEQFNETILIISIIFNHFLGLFKLEELIYISLEVYSFVLFIRAKYDDILKHNYINSLPILIFGKENF
ncbi:hypothetical protein H312_02418, partial [Anncaliia algerae PRA339]